MDAGLSTARQARLQYRHELRSLTYVTIDQANGGIVRNLTRDGIGVQAVAAIPPNQQVRVRFELREPRLRIETRGEVAWSTPSGQCGIRFLDLSPKLTRQISEWIFGNLLEGGALHSAPAGSMFTAPATEEDDGLLISAAPRKVIELPLQLVPQEAEEFDSARILSHTTGELDWLAQPLSGGSLARTINSLIVVAASLLFALVFLSVTREPPPWPFRMALGSTVTVSVLYWGFFKICGGPSLGTRLSRLATLDEDGEAEAGTRFR